MIKLYGGYFPDEYKNYHGCNNCEYQPEPLVMCEWGKHRDRVEPICTGWKERKESE